MDDKEKQYWFDILPSMTDTQIDRLFNILETERKKLEELELKYQDEIKTLNEKHLKEWEGFQIKSTLDKLDDDSMIFIITNDTENSKIMPYTLTSLKNKNQANKNIIYNDFKEKFDIYKTKDYLSSTIFNHFAKLVKRDFENYYKVYSSMIFEILETYYQNISYTKDLKKEDLLELNKFEKLNIAKEDKEKLQKLFDKVEFLYEINRPVEEADDTLQYFIKQMKEDKSGDIFLRLYHTLYIDTENKNAKDFIKLINEKIKKDSYKYLTDYKKNININKLESQLIITKLAFDKYKNIIDKDVLSKVNQTLHELMQNRENFDNTHYFEMTNLFLDHTKQNELDAKITKLKQEYSENETNEELQAQLLEYITYSIINKDINNLDFEEDLSPLTSLKQNIMPYSKAGQYLELKFLEFFNTKKIKNEEMQNAKDASNRELEKVKNDKTIENLISLISLLIMLFGVYASIKMIVHFTFRGLLLNNALGCKVVTSLLLLKFKFISNFTQSHLLTKLQKHLIERISSKNNKIINIISDNFNKKVIQQEYANENSKHGLIISISKEYNLLPIILRRDIDLRIGCLDDLLHNIEFSKYLFALDMKYFQIHEQQEEMIAILKEKYSDAKIIVFIQSTQGETKK